MFVLFFVFWHVYDFNNNNNNIYDNIGIKAKGTIQIKESIQGNGKGIKGTWWEMEVKNKTDTIIEVEVVTEVAEEDKVEVGIIRI